MSGAAAGEGVRAIAFASPDGSVWGAAISDGERWSLASGPAGSGDGPIDVTVELDGGWRLEGGGGALSLLATADDPPAGPAVDGYRTPGGPGSAFVPGESPELCRVTGSVSGDVVEWRGVRVTVAPPRSAKDAPGSVRFVTGWLADGSAVGLIAVRSRRNDHPDGDAVSATLFDPERWLAVSDPRLSTTYDASGAPARVNLELWIGDGEHEYPRRAAGEAAAAPSASAGPGGALQVLPLRCHSRGEEGVGLYVLATF